LLPYQGLSRFGVQAQPSETPWRRQRQRQPRSNQRNYRYNDFVQHNPNYQPRNNVKSNDWNSHFIEYNEVQSDPRARYYHVNMKSRSIGKLSWSSQLIWSNIATFALHTFKPAVTQWGVKLSDKILRGQQLYRLVTPVFLHGGVAHLFTNMVSLSR
jgi:membrane associated rhomboid family serine protease